MIYTTPMVVLLHLPIEAAHARIDHVLLLTKLVTVKLKLLLALLLNKGSIFLIFFGTNLCRLFFQTCNNG